MEPIGVVDIGSNSVRLVVYEGAVRAPTPVFNEKILCGLGRSVATTGSLGTEAVERALAALARFKIIARILSVKNLKVIATAAVRDAQNGRSFIEQGQLAIGAKIEILSGDTEARLAAQGIIMGFVDPDGVVGTMAPTSAGSGGAPNLRSASPWVATPRAANRSAARASWTRIRS